MCGIAGCVTLKDAPIPDLGRRLAVMNDLISHRGPDGHGTWRHHAARVGLTHRRLTIIDLTTGEQPMTDAAGNWITYNGEIYNYIELRSELGGADSFRTTSDTEVILRAYERWGTDCVQHLRGMFAFALWDEAKGMLFCARDRFGIKPFYYAVDHGVLSFASEAKALLPFLPGIETDRDAFRDYLAFQACLDGKTLFKGIRELPAGHELRITSGRLDVRRYWEVFFRPNVERKAEDFDEELRSLMEDSVRVHLRADVPVGAYLSGGLDSSIVASLATRERGTLTAFTGKFPIGPEYDESHYARELATAKGIDLHELAVTVDDLVEHIGRVIYHLDYPVAGPGAFPQYMVSALAAKHLKVVLGGQGGDELFGGYARYLVAYLEQSLKGAIDGTMHQGTFVVDYASILPNLGALRAYKPMLQEFWREDLFGDMDRRYFRLINRTPRFQDQIRWDHLGDYSPYESFRSIFYADNIAGESYLDRMTHFDFKALLPALLQVEDRVSMAHGLESRLPYLDHPVVELAATMPATVKFAGGRMKRSLISALGDTVPRSIAERQDKMGFPTPFNEWAKGEANGYVMDVMTSKRALSRDLIDNGKVVEHIRTTGAYDRDFWGFFSLELWQQAFHDRATEFARRGDSPELANAAAHS
jgi:asparagine synthase (glutamine-hydrolysing)